MWWSSGKESSCQFRRFKRCRLYPWIGKIPWRRKWQLTPVFLPGESPWTEELGRKQSVGSQRVRETERLSTHIRLTNRSAVSGEGLKAGEEGDARGWDGWVASPPQWTWVWASCRSWWWTQKPGVLQSMGLQRVGHDWVTELTDWCQGKEDGMGVDLRLWIWRWGVCDYSNVIGD